MADPFSPFKVDLPLESQRGFNTRQIHSGAVPDPATKARAVPIYSTAPTVEVLEKRVAALEGGTAAVACASGQSGVFQTVLCLAHAGDNIISSINLYGGTYSLFKCILPRLGISVKWVQDSDPESYRKQIDDHTKLVFVETVGNPRISIPDLRAIADIAHDNKLPFAVDNTFGAGGFWCPAIEHGADIVIHSATKWLGGHGTTVGGIIVDSGRFDWSESDKFPHLTKTSEGPMAFSYASAFGNVAFALALRIEVVMEVGAVMNPFAAHQILVGIETLSLRCERIASNSMRIAEFLSDHPLTGWISYPDCKTMATHPWGSTHSIMTEEDRLSAGVTEDLIRLSVGTEDVEDIIADLSRAFDAIVLIHENVQTSVDRITPQTCNIKSDVGVNEVESSVVEML
ncbi:homocysteine synthase [Aspergillus taichungensis]|uniref:Homocysteine synthase n=1 Tax=Aspergillus taichungensis TaxID=482145 RepID=A0A2J5I9V2_9EURO|nr:homocysteine synthase [Aspergillus taichungensis]